MYNFVVNFRSGKGQGAKCIRKISEYCDSRGYDYQVFETCGVGHASFLTRYLCNEGAKIIIAVGGDGTFHEVLNGLTEGVALGFIPAGRGNDFARTAGLEKNPIDAFKVIERGKQRRIDYLLCNGVRCLNVAGTGMDVDVLQAVENKNNSISYYFSLVRCLISFKPYHVKISVNGEVFEKDCIMAGVCNGTCFGGGIRVSPNARLNSGKLDVVIAEKLKRNLLRMLPAFAGGNHEKLPEITHIEAEEVEIDGDYPVELDGEIYYNMTAPYRFSVVKGGLITF